MFIHVEILLFSNGPRDKVGLLCKVAYTTTVKGNNLLEQISFNKFSAAVHEDLNEVELSFISLTSALSYS